MPTLADLRQCTDPQLTDKLLISDESASAEDRDRYALLDDLKAGMGIDGLTAATNTITLPDGKVLTLAATGTLNPIVTGTWTPDLRFNNAKVGITYTTQVGTYMQIGKLVLFSCYIVLSNKGSSSGYASVYGLPASAKSDSVRYIFPVRYYTMATNYTHMAAELAAGNAFIGLLATTAAAAGQDGIQNTNFNNTSVLDITGWYQAA